MQADRPSLYTSQFIVMAAANLFVVSSLGMFYLLPVFIEVNGGSRADVGILMGAIGFSSVLCRPWTSGVPDRLGRKSSYTLSCALMASIPLGFLSLAGDLAEFYKLLMFLRLVQGVALALYFTAGLTYVVDIVPSSRLNEGVGMFGAAGLAGMAIGPAIAEMVLSHWGFQVLFVTSSALATLGLVLQLPLQGPPHSRPDRGAPSFFSVLFRSKTLIVVLLSSLFGLAMATITNFVVPWAMERQIMPASLFFISYSTSAIAVRLIGGGLGDRLGERRLLPFALIVTSSGMLLLSALNSSAVLILAGLVTGCGTGILFPCLGALTVRGEPSEIRGKLNGIFTGSIDAGIFSGSILLGYVGEWFGYGALFLTATIGLLLGIIAVRRLVPRQPQNRAPHPPDP